MAAPTGKPGAKDKPQVIRVVRKKAGHGGHHGGAWKVAYADFVTAMMALFMVLWIIAMKSEARSSIAGYFRDPVGFAKKQVGGHGMLNSQEAQQLKKALRQMQRKQMEAAKAAIEQAIAQDSAFAEAKKYIEITMTDEGLRIELLDAERSFFFESGSATLKPAAERILGIIAHELGRLQNPVSVEGHTDAAPFRYEGRYSNWELSSDRANAARRVMETTGLRGGQVTEVRGLAATHLRKKDDPMHYSNRRVSITAKYTEGAASATPAETDAIVGAAAAAQDSARRALGSRRP